MQPQQFRGPHDVGSRAARRAVKHGEFAEEVATAHSGEYNLLASSRSDRHHPFPIKDQINRACKVALAEKNFSCLVIATSTQTRECGSSRREKRRAIHWK